MSRGDPGIWGVSPPSPSPPKKDPGARYLDVPPTLAQPLGQQRHHVLVVLQQLLQQDAVPRLLALRLDLGGRGTATR